MAVRTSSHTMVSSRQEEHRTFGEQGEILGARIAEHYAPGLAVPSNILAQYEACPASDPWTPAPDPDVWTS